MSHIKVTIVSAEKELYSGNVTFFAGTSDSGELGVYRGHLPMIALLKPGQVRLTLEDGSEDVFWVSGGVMEVQPDEIIVLANSAERADALDQAAAERLEKKTKLALRDKNQEDFDAERALVELNIARSQLDALKRLKK